jgi:DNA-binding response OmpR family regulator
LIDRWEVETVHHGRDALRVARERRPDVIVTDIMMPELDGFGLLRELRADPKLQSIPVIMLSARAGEEARIEGLAAGADDYLIKPFSAEHLSARLTAVLWRASRSGPTAELRVGGLCIDLERREVTLDGAPLELTRREFDLLAYLAARPGRVVARRELLAEVWRQAYGDDQTIDVHLSWLRRKLGETAAKPRYLHTVRGVGVRLAEPEEKH